MSPDVVPGHLFAYGTLLPGEPRWHFLEPYVTDHGMSDAASGQVYDTGQGYPAARFDVDAVIRGRSFALRPDSVVRALEVLDEVEGAVGGLYHRVTITTHAGRVAWAYQYGGGLQLEPIPSGSWLERI